ncbi:unnamed protein product [Cunninghamella blakesleeana]
MSLSSDDISGDIDDEGYYYEVEKILDDEIQDGVVKYLIKWKNYDKEFNTWEPEENLSCPELLEEYIMSKKKRRRDTSPGVVKKKKKSTETKKDSKKKTKKTNAESTVSEPLSLHHTMQSVLTTPIHKNNSLQSTSSGTTTTDNNNNSNNEKLVNDGVANKTDDNLQSTSVIHFSTTTPSLSPSSSPSSSSSISANTTSSSNKIRSLTIRPPERKPSNEKKPVLALSGESSHTAPGFVNKKRPTIGQSSTRSFLDLYQAMSGKSPTNPKPPFQSTSKPIPKRPSNTQRSNDDDTKRVRIEPRDSVSPPYSKYNTTTNIYPSNRQVPSSSSTTHINNNVVSSSSKVTTPTTSPKNINATVSMSSSHNNTNITTTTTTTTTSHNYNVISPTQTMTPSNHNIIPPSHNNITSPTHSNLTSPVHKSSLANVPQKIELPSRPAIWHGQIKKKSVPVIGVKLELIHDPSKLIDDALSFLKACELQIETYLPIERLNHTLRSGNHCIMEAVATDGGKYIIWSKFRGFLTINECAGIVRSSKRPKEVLALVMTSVLKGYAFRDTYKGLSVVYINGLIPDCAPKLNRLTNAIGFKLNSNWKTLAGLLGFPEEFDSLFQESNVRFEVYGSTELANWLRTTVNSSPPSSTNIKKRVLLFERFSDELFKKSLTLEKFDDNAMIYEFGIYSLADVAIEPMIEVYPKSTGGFITTDVGNILTNPDILDHMVETESKLKEKYQFSEWRIIIHNDFLNQIKYVHSSKATIEAVTRLLLLLNTNQIHIMELYDEEEKEEELPNEDPKKVTMKWYSDIVRSYVDQYQAFIYIDGSNSGKLNQELYPSIDFVNNENIQSI